MELCPIVSILAPYFVRLKILWRLFFLQVMISRNYRGDIDFGIIDKFIPVLTEREEEGNLTPLITTAGVTFAYVKFNNLYRTY